MIRPADGRISGLGHVARGQQAGRWRRRARVALVSGGAAMLVCPAAVTATVHVSPTLRPAARTVTIAEYGAHLTWVQRLRDSSGARVRVVLDRSRGRTVALPITRPVTELDVGPGPSGTPVAVYQRCEPRCDIWRYDYARRRESRVSSVSTAMADEGRPSVWGRRIAFERGGAILLGDLRHVIRRTLVRKLPDETFDLELGADHLAYVSYFLNGPGVEGDIELRLHPLAGGAEQVLDDEEVGETSWTSISAVTFLGAQLVWQLQPRDGCQTAAARFSSYDVRTGSQGPLTTADVPLGVSRAADTGPDLVGCG